MNRLITILFVLFISVSISSATDLAIGKIIFPVGDVETGEKVYFKFGIDNLNVLAALNYTVDVILKNRIGGSVVYSETVEGTPVQPYSTVEMVTLGYWLAVAGQYDLQLRINFDEEINPANNTANSAFNVLAAAVAMQLYYSNWVFPIVRQSLTHGLLIATFQPSAQWRYFNFIAAKTRAIAAVWVLQNILIPPWANPLTYAINADLYQVLKDDKTPPDSLFVKAVVSDHPFDSQDSVGTTTDKALSFTKYDLSVSYGLKDYLYANITYDPPAIAPTSTTVRDSVYYGCNIPNIDLDVTAHNSTNTPGYASDWNACAPTAAANSMQWLENTFPKINSGLSHRQKLMELSKCMKREDSTGVWIEDFIRGKLAYINKHNLPIKVKFQVRGLTRNVRTWADDDYFGEAENKGTGVYPEFDFLRQELKDSEDVEVFVEFHDRVGDSSTVIGRHVITATGAAAMSDYDRFWYKDDKNQGAAGGNTESPVFWAKLRDSTPYINHGTYADGRKNYTVPYGVVSESPDYTRKRTEKGIFERLIDGAVGLAGRYEHADSAVDWLKSHPIRFGHVVHNAGGIVDKPSGEVQAFTPNWIVKNYPIGDVFGIGTYTFVDPAAIGVSAVPTPTEVEVRVLYTDNPVKTMPTFDSTYRTYLITQISGAALGGSPNGDAAVETPPANGVKSVMPEPNGMPYSVTKFKVIQDISMSKLDRTASNQIGGGAVSSFNALVDLIARQNTGSVATENTYAQTATAMKYSSDKKGIVRSDAMNGMLSTIDDGRWLISPEFQSTRLPAGDIPSAVFPGHLAKNSSSNSTKGISYEWLYNSLMANGPLMVELGWYDSSKRISGTWVPIYGIVEHNGMKRVLMPIDINEETVGGLRWTVATIAEDDGYLYLPEFSTSTKRCDFETAVSLKYDPTLVWTGVGEDPSKEIYNLAVLPQPASDEVTIRWTQAKTATATARIVNSVGQTVQQVQTTSGELGFTWNVNTSSLAPGTYVVIVQSDLATASMRFIVVR